MQTELTIISNEKLVNKKEEYFAWCRNIFPPKNVVHPNWLSTENLIGRRETRIILFYTGVYIVGPVTKIYLPNFCLYQESFRFGRANRSMNMIPIAN